ncbi:proton-conducting transporter membrane subunit [Persephonella sp.]|uniref:proton-conducting transporter transmembrane domain-containing protein n=1 Tax=Persephonella sp. TaxID=2060922 RepID=UPI0026353ED0|nr:proton-conducting transporter membrane subunit [Persephonella sp.]
MEEGSSFLWSLFLLFFLPVITSPKYKISFYIQIIATLIVALLSINFLLNGDTVSFSLGTNIPYLNLSFYIDKLSAFFILVVSTLAFAVSIYSLNYIEEFKNKSLFAFLFHSFILSLILVLTSFNAFIFLISWEIMSVLSFFLVIFEYKNEENKKSGFIYILMTHFGTAFIILSFLIMFINTGSLDFKDWFSADIPDNAKFWAFIFALIGFGTKAGIFPLHIWLPKAHPVAPSNVSALMSGVMIKTAIYMLVRYYFQFLTDIPWWFGFIVLFIGAVSALFGIMFAYVQTNLKKLLAYSSMENIGIILLGLGSSMLFAATNFPVLSALALLAALFHVYNHALFKGLLFLGAGSILFKTHTKNMEKYGGLIKAMPLSSLFIIIGSISISALPPFNGFVSEWLTYMSLILSTKIDINTVKIFVPIFASMLALTGAFAAASFVKVIGVSLLGNPRSEASRNATEVGIFMLIGMGILTVLCFVFGVFPLAVVDLISKPIYALIGIDIYNHVNLYAGLILIATDYSLGRISPFGLLIAGLVFGMGIYVLIKTYGKTKVRKYETWKCGLDEVNPKAQYSATGFSQPIKKIFAVLYRPVEKIVSVENKQKYFLPEKKYEASISDIFEIVITKITNLLLSFLLWIRNIFQMGIIHIYLGFISLTLTILLIYVVWFSGGGN